MPTHPIAPIGLQAQRTASALVKSVCSYLFDSKWWLRFANVRFAGQAAWRLSLVVALIGGVAHAQIINRVAGNGNQGVAAQGQPALTQPLGDPTAVAVGGAGRVLIMDARNSRVLRVTAGVLDVIPTPGLAQFAQQMAVDAAGNLFIANTRAHNILRVDGDTGVVTVYAGAGQGAAANNVQAGAALFQFPNGIALDRSGNLLVADTNNHVVRRIDRVTLNVSIVAGTGTAGFGGDTGLATAAQINQPYHLAVDNADRVVMVDFQNRRIRRFTVGGNIETLAGRTDLGNASSGNGGLATAASFGVAIRGLAIDGTGRIYVSDTDANVVRRFTPGGNIEIIAGNGTGALAGGGLSIAGDGGPPLNAGLAEPSGLWIDRNGNLLVAQEANYVIRQITGLASPPVPPDTAFTVPAGGALPASAVVTEVSGLVSSLTVRATIDFSAAARSAPASGRAGPSGPLQVFLVALVPGRLLQVPQPAVIFLQDSQARWGPLTNPVQAFARNVDPSTLSQNRLVVTILSSFDSTLLPGTEFYLGYGRDADEMIAAGRYRGVYKVLP